MIQRTCGGGEPPEASPTLNSPMSRLNEGSTFTFYGSFTGALLQFFGLLCLRNGFRCKATRFRVNISENTPRRQGTRKRTLYIWR